MADLQGSVLSDGDVTRRVPILTALDVKGMQKVRQRVRGVTCS
jgi:hypothetical protein